jgi:hypothetical protein
VKARQAVLAANKTNEGEKGCWTRRRPQYLFSGLMKCSVRRRRYLEPRHIRCANARNKGTCANKRTMRQDDPESLIPDGLQQRLIDPALPEVSCREYSL